MKTIVDKLKTAEQEISNQKGQFALFALFLPEDSEDKWDLLVSSSWINENKQDALKYIARKVQKTLTPKELTLISRIVIIDEDNPALNSIHRAIHVEHGDAEIQNSNFFGLFIKHAYLITSKKEQKK